MNPELLAFIIYFAAVLAIGLVFFFKTKNGGDTHDNFNWKIRTFLDACKNGTPSPVPSSQIIYNQAILDGIARSAELGHEVEIEIPEV